MRGDFARVTGAIDTSAEETTEGPDPGSDFTPIVVEDFERSSPLGDYSGDTGAGTIVATPVEHGSNALELASGNRIISTSGLPDYPAAGDEFEFYIYPTSGQVGRFLFGVQDASNWFGVAANPDADAVRLLKLDGGAPVEVLASADTAVATGEYLFGQINWFDDGQLDVTFAGTLFGASDATYASGGIGWEVVPA
jgi:hypothetical protein